jgi:hypothetical protein
MRAFFRTITSNIRDAAKLIGYLGHRKLWWLIPMVVLLLLFGLMVVFASTSGLGPFIYTLF